MRQERDMSPDESPRNPQRRKVGCCVAAAIGAAAGGLCAYLILYWGEAVLPSVAQYLVPLVLLPFSTMLLFLPGYAQHGMSYAAACGMWALVGMTVGILWYPRRPSPETGRRGCAKTALVIAMLVLYAVNIVVMPMTRRFVTGGSGYSPADISRDTDIWFPPGTAVVGSHLHYPLHYYLLRATLTIDDQDYDRFLRALKSRHTVTRDDHITKNAKDYAWWRPDLVRDPIMLRVAAAESVRFPGYTELIIDRHHPARKSTIYLWYRQ